MAKVTGPLFSFNAKGTIGKAITYGKNQYGNWTRGFFNKKYTSSSLQKVIRDLFKEANGYFKDMSAEEKFLWNLALKNYQAYGVAAQKWVARWAKCLFLHHVLLSQSFLWNGSPFPPNLYHMFAKDEIAGYDQIVSDLMVLTGLSFCKEVDPYFFSYLGRVTSIGHPHLGGAVGGLCNYSGVAIAIDEDYYKGLEVWDRKYTIAHELTHAIMSHHGWKYNWYVAISETIADECGVRIANNALTPVYTYKGNTLSQLVPYPSCP